MQPSAPERFSLPPQACAQSLAIELDVDGGLKFNPSIGIFNIGALSGSGNLSLSDLNGSPISLQIGGVLSSGTYAGVISGTGSLSLGITLSGANTFSGVTTPFGCKLANSNALQNSTVSISNSISRPILFSPSIGTFTLGGLSAASGSSAAIDLYDDSGFPVTLQIGNNNSSTTYGGAIDDNLKGGAITKIGTGTLILTNNNNLYNGPTSVNAGKLQLGAAKAVQFSPLFVNVDGGLSFSPSIGLFHVGGLGGSGDFSLTDTSGAAVTLELDTLSATNTTYAGAMSGSGALIFAGGALALTGVNTFTGSTNVNQGTLQLATANALQNSTLVMHQSGKVNFSPMVGTFNVGGLSDADIESSLSLSDSTGGAVALALGSNNSSTTFSSVISGVGSIKKIGTGTLTLRGANSFSGESVIASGALQVANTFALQNSTVVVNVDGGIQFSTFAPYSFGGLSGSGSFAIAAPSSPPLQLIVGTNNASTVYTGAMSGSGALTKVGLGSLTLSGANTYSGKTTVIAGTVEVTGSLANNGSSSVSVAGETDFSAASLSRRVKPGGSYAGMGSRATKGVVGLLISSADIRAGQDNAALPIDLAMQWRVRAMGDGPGIGSDVLNLTGMSAATGANVQSDPFALQMTYNPAALGGVETTLAANGLLVLGWLDTTMNEPFGLWENSTAGNFGSGMPGDVFPNVQSSWDAFAAANAITDANFGNFLGSYGVDVVHHQVWAVVNHNSQFATLPEPASWELLAAAAALVGGLRAIRRRARRRSSADSAD